MIKYNENFVDYKKAFGTDNIKGYIPKVSYLFKSYISYFPF